MTGRLAPRVAALGLALAFTSLAPAGGDRGSSRIVGVAAAATARSASSTTPGAPPGASPGASPLLAEHWSLARLRAEVLHRRGRPLVIHLWASWCGPCLEELPAIETFAQKARARGITVLSLSLDAAPDASRHVPVVLRARAPSLTAIIADFDDPDAFVAQFQPGWEGSIPALFVYDRAGALRESLLEPAGTAELDRLVDRLTAPAGPAAAPGPKTSR